MLLLASMVLLAVGLALAALDVLSAIHTTVGGGKGPGPAFMVGAGLAILGLLGSVVALVQAVIS